VHLETTLAHQNKIYPHGDKILPLKSFIIYLQKI